MEEKYIFIHKGNYIVEFDDLDSLKKYCKENIDTFIGAIRMFRSPAMVKGTWTYAQLCLGELMF